MINRTLPWDELKKRFTAFLRCENETALIAVNSIQNSAAFKRRRPTDAPPEEMQCWFLDARGICDCSMARIANTFFGGEAFPVVMPDFGTAGHAKYFKGCRYQIAEDTVWYFPSLQAGDLPEYLGSGSILHDELSCIRQLCELGSGKFLVAMPDNCGTIDALAHLRGSDNLLMDMLEEPDWVLACTRKIMEGYFDSSRKIFDAIRDNNLGGSSHSWMQLLADGRAAQLQADLSVMISPKMYEKFVLPDLDEACSWLDYAIYHLDGQEQIRHLGMLLSIRNLNAIQWTHVAGQPEVTEFIPVFQRIQSAGKGLIIFPESIRQMQILLENLKPQGLYLIANHAGSEAEANGYLKLRTCR